MYKSENVTFRSHRVRPQLTVLNEDNDFKRISDRRKRLKEQRQKASTSSSSLELAMVKLENDVRQRQIKRVQDNINHAIAKAKRVIDQREDKWKTRTEFETSYSRYNNFNDRPRTSTGQSNIIKSVNYAKQIEAEETILCHVQDLSSLLMRNEANNGPKRLDHHSTDKTVAVNIIQVQMEQLQSQHNIDKSQAKVEIVSCKGVDSSYRQSLQLVLNCPQVNRHYLPEEMGSLFRPSLGLLKLRQKAKATLVKMNCVACKSIVFSYEKCEETCHLLSVKTAKSANRPNEKQMLTSVTVGGVVVTKQHIRKSISQVKDIQCQFDMDRVQHIHVLESNKEDEESDWEYYSESEDEDSKVGSKIVIPAALMNRWNFTIWDDDEDSDEDEDDYEDQETDPMSPYYALSDGNIFVYAAKYRSISQKIKDWLNEVKDQDESQFNQKISDKLCQVNISNDEETESKTDYVYHGYYRRFKSEENSKELFKIGKSVKNVQYGVQWEEKTGHSYIVTKCVNQDENNNDIIQGVYVYPDFIHAIVGQFSVKAKKLINGKFGYINGISYEDDPIIPYPTIEVLNKTENYKDDVSTSLCISTTPLLRDPYEHLMVYVKQSEIPMAGEGLFAKMNVQSGTLMSIFNGTRVRDSHHTRNNKGFTDYKIGLTSDVCLDIPNWCISLEKYRASLGHKCCHSFQPNTEFEELYHPRFGHVMSIVAKTDIQKDEELLVNYNYALHVVSEMELYISTFVYPISQSLN